jgi:ribosomal protein L18E
MQRCCTDAEMQRQTPRHLQANSRVRCASNISKLAKQAAVMCRLALGEGKFVCVCGGGEPLVISFIS